MFSTLNDAMRMAWFLFWMRICSNDLWSCSGHVSISIKREVGNESAAFVSRRFESVYGLGKYLVHNRVGVNARRVEEGKLVVAALTKNQRKLSAAEYQSIDSIVIFHSTDDLKQARARFR